MQGTERVLLPKFIIHWENFLQGMTTMSKELKSNLLETDPLLEVSGAPKLILTLKFYCAPKRVETI